MAGPRDFTLVCGGGGVWGVAWMTGLVTGLAEAGTTVRNAARMIGTSAGSVMSAQLSSPLSIEYLFQRQTDPSKQPLEFAPTGDRLNILTELLRRPWRDEEERLRAVVKIALEAKTISAEERRRHVTDRLGLPDHDWPQTPLQTTAVDAQTLELRVFDAASGVSLVDAVAASCAVPGIWPPTPINGKLYVDGGVWRTAENAHLAEGSKAVLILSPMGRASGAALGISPGLRADIARLEAQGAKVLLICADAASLRTMGPGPLDPATRKPAAEAGLQQGAREADAARAFFESI